MIFRIKTYLLKSAVFFEYFSASYKCINRILSPSSWMNVETSSSLSPNLSQSRNKNKSLVSQDYLANKSA